MSGINETKEVLKLAIVLTKVIKTELKDGASLSDLIAVFVAIQGDPEKKAVMESALKDIHLVGEEAKDITFAEGFELLTLVASELLAPKA